MEWGASTQRGTYLLCRELCSLTIDSTIPSMACLIEVLEQSRWLLRWFVMSSRVSLVFQTATVSKCILSMSKKLTTRHHSSLPCRPLKFVACTCAYTVGAKVGDLSRRPMKYEQPSQGISATHQTGSALSDECLQEDASRVLASACQLRTHIVLWSASWYQRRSCCP